MSATGVADALRAALAKDTRLHAWQLRTIHRDGFQTYLVKSQLESERRTAGKTCDLTVFVKNGEMMGRAAIVLGPEDAPRVSQRLDQAIYMASLGGDAPWALPSSGTWPKVEAFDPALSIDRARATSREIVEAWRSTLAAQKGVRPSSMELFCGEDAITLENSAGLSAQSSTTQVSMLTLVLADGAHPAERYAYDERRRVSDLDVKAIVKRAADEARDLTKAVAPPSGSYPVVFDAEEFRAFLDPIQQNASGESLYQKSSRFEIGQKIPIEGTTGEPFTLISNALAPYGLTSYAFDGNGVPGQRVEIVKDGVFVRPWATKQFADYLKTTPTGGFANWELPLGKTPLAELTGGADKVLYVRSFSWLTPEQGRGNFGSEVRVGYLYDKNGARTPVKGGSVSGSVFKALGTAHYSKDSVFLGDYLGPAAVRFEGLSISGT